MSAALLKKYFWSPILFVAGFLLFAVSFETVRAETKGPVLKISVLKSGKIFSEGREISLADLDKELQGLQQKKGVIWYYREAGEEEPPPSAMEVIQLVVQHELPIRLSSKPDFSDFVDEHGQIKTR